MILVSMIDVQNSMLSFLFDHDAPCTITIFCHLRWQIHYNIMMLSLHFREITVKFHCANVCRGKSSVYVTPSGLVSGADTYNDASLLMHKEISSFLLNTSGYIALSMNKIRGGRVARDWLCGPIGIGDTWGHQMVKKWACSRQMTHNSGMVALARP